MAKDIIVHKDFVKDCDSSAYDLSDVYSYDFVRQMGFDTDNLGLLSDYANEIFLYFYLQVYELSALLLKCKGKKVRIALNSSLPIRVVAAHRSKKRVSPFVLSVLAITNVVAFMAFVICVFSSSFFVAFSAFRWRQNKNGSRCLAVVRTPASYHKMKGFRGDGVDFYFDSLSFSFGDEGRSVYGVPFVKKIISFFVLPVLAGRDSFLICKDSLKAVGFWGMLPVFIFYSPRIAHKVLYEYYLNSLLSFCRCEVYYTGNKDDRFAVLESRVCSKKGIKVLCIPHGLEYSYKMPVGLPGDVFYCTTKHSEAYLTDLYDSRKFVFNPLVVEKMFSRCRVASSRRLVFFTESRGVEVNHEIIQLLLSINEKIYVKLHPKDSKENYSKYGKAIEFIEDIDEAISGNFCLARKSTVLVEAIYNDSKAISILIDKKDEIYSRYVFSSLNSPEIVQVKTVDDLRSTLLSAFQIGNLE